MVMLCFFLIVNNSYSDNALRDELSRSKATYYDVHPITKPMTITVPGFYILANNITGNIIINADNVIVLLNHKKIMNAKNAIVVDQRTNIYVHDGVIEGSSEEGISINQSSNVVLSGINFAKNTTAVSITGSMGVQVNHCTFTESVTQGLHIKDSECCSIAKNILFKNLADRLITIDHCSGIIVSDVVVSNNQASSIGEAVITIVNSIDCLCKKSKIRNNKNFAAGIESVHSKGTVIDFCSITYNSCQLDRFEGIALRGDVHSAISNCVINDNEAIKPEASVIGIAVSSTFADERLLHCKECFVDHNKVMHNYSSAQSIGFLQTSIEGNNVFLRNIAQGHTLNYNFFPSKYPIITLDAATGIIAAQQVKLVDNLSIVTN